MEEIILSEPARLGMNEPAQPAGLLSARWQEVIPLNMVYKCGVFALARKVMH